MTGRSSLAIGMALAIWLALLVFTPSETALGQTTPRKPTVATGQPSAPLAPPPPGVTAVAATPVRAPTVQATIVPIATATIGLASATPTVLIPLTATVGTGTASPTAIVVVTTATPAAPLATASPVGSPGAIGTLAAATPGLSASTPSSGAAVSTPAVAVGVSAPVRNDNLPPTIDQILGLSGAVIASAQVPSNLSDSTASVITTMAGSPIRMNLVVPTRQDGATEVSVRETTNGTMARISATGVLLSRAFDIEIRGADGRLLRVHDRPITLVIAIESTDVLMANGDRRKLRLARWDDGKGAAELLPTRVDEAAGTLTAETRQTSTFMIVVFDAGTTLSAIPWVTVDTPNHVIPSRMPRVGDAAQLAGRLGERDETAFGVRYTFLALGLAAALVVPRLLGSVGASRR